MIVALQPAARECTAASRPSKDVGLDGDVRSEAVVPEGGYSRARRPNRSRHRDVPERRPQPVAKANPFDYNEDDIDDDGSDSRGRSSGSRIGLWIVLVLILAVIGILAFFAYQQLN